MNDKEALLFALGPGAMWVDRGRWSRRNSCRS